MKRLAICAAVLGLAACGGSSASTLTKAQFDAKLSHLCLVADDQFRELHVDDTVASFAHDGPQILRINASFAAKLRALKPPESIKSAVAAYTAAEAKAAQDDKDAVAAAKAGDAAKLHAAIVRANHDGLATWPFAKQIGAKGCYIG